MGRFDNDNSNLPAKNFSIKGIFESDITRKKFQEILGKNGNSFVVSVLNTVNSNEQLSKADPESILKAAIVAATLNLPIDPNLGFAYIVPYKRKIKENNQEREVIEAQFQLGYKGYIQLAIRTGQYENINVTELYEGQFIHYDPVTDELKYDMSTRNSDTVTHYVSFFKTLNGFKKYFIMSKEEIENHAKTYSQAYNSKFSYLSPWKKDFDGMAKKTVLKLLLSKFGILSIDMQTAQKVDQAVIKEVNEGNFEVEYQDNPTLTISEANENNNDIDESNKDLSFDSAAKFKK